MGASQNTIRTKINVVTLCSGYGAQEMAFDRLRDDYPEFDWELLAWSEIEPNAILAHQTCHPEYTDRNLGDMTTCDYSKITERVDVLFYSTPCQSVSLAGRRKGMKEGSDAASALIWHTRRAIETLKPHICILENVKGMVAGENLKEFHKWQNVMSEYGYTNFAQILNSKDFGVPQNRERLFMISILDCTKSYHFPEPFKLEKRIKDMLEPYGTVDESFYFSANRLAGMFDHCAKKKSEGHGFQTQFATIDSIACCVTTRYGSSCTDAYLKEPALFNTAVGGIFRTIKSSYAKAGAANFVRSDGYGTSGVLETFPIQRFSIYDNNAQAGRVYDVNGIAPTLKCYTGGNSEPKILTTVRTEEAKRLRREKGIEIFANRQLVPREDGISNTITTVTKDYLLQEPCILGYTRNDKGKVCDRHEKDIANTIHRSTGSGGNTDQYVKEPIGTFFENLPDKTVLQDEDGKGYLWQDSALWRVRKLTPRELFRLQDVSEDDIDKILAAGISKTACYTLAGNSITVAPLYHIFRKLFIDTTNESQQPSLFDF